MNLGLLFLESISTGVITSVEMNWATSNQAQFSRVEEATALKLGRLLYRGFIQIGCRVYYESLFVLLLKGKPKKCWMLFDPESYLNRILELLT